MSSMDRDQALEIMKSSFPRMESIKIITNTTADGNSHFTSNVNHFTIEYMQDGKLQQKQVVIKVPNSDEISNLFDGMNYYNREISLYEVVLPKVTKYLDKSLTPAHLHTTESRILVLEDVTALGYKSGEKLPLFNLNETKCVLMALADFHAASHKLHEEDPHFLENLLFPLPPSILFRGVIISSFGPVVLELLKRKNEISLISKVKRAMAFLEKDDDEIKSRINQSQFKFVVLNHGDCRKENFLLKHDSNNQVERVQFIDFQISMWSSPLLDIFYFFASSVSISVIESHYDELISGYLHTLNGKCKKLACSSLYERADLKEDFKNLRFYLFSCVLLSCVYLCPMDVEQKKALGLPQSQIDIDHLCDLCLNDDKFVHEIYGWLKYCEKCNIFESY